MEEFMRVLVFGGRTYDNRAAVFTALDALHARRRIGLLIHGACPNRIDRDTGRLIWSADMLAEDWAKKREIPYCGWPARWRTGTRGKGEGMARNQHMLEKTRPTYGLGFPGGPGSADMARRLKQAGIPVQLYPESEA